MRRMMGLRWGLLWLGWGWLWIWWTEDTVIDSRRFFWQLPQLGRWCWNINMTMLNMTMMTRVTRATMIMLMTESIAWHGWWWWGWWGWRGEDAGPHQVRGKVKAAEEKANHKISRTDWLPPIHPCFTFGQSNSSSHKVPRVSPDFLHFFRHFLESLRALFTKFLETWCHLISDWTADEVCWLLSH